jgi:hypothetical protein
MERDHGIFGKPGKGNPDQPRKYPTPTPKAVFNETNENIEWARWTWNPVTGCLQHPNSWLGSFQLLNLVISIKISLSLQKSFPPKIIIPPIVIRVELCL